MFLKKSAEKKI